MSRKDPFKKILSTFRQLPVQYQEKIRLLADITKTKWDDLYYDILRRAIQRSEERNDSKNYPKPISKDLPIFVPAPYYVPRNLWEKLEPHTIKIQRFARFRREYIKPEMESSHHHYVLRDVSDKQLKRMGRKMLKSEIKILPALFHEPPRPTSPRKYFLHHFRHVDKLLKKHGVEKSLDLTFEHYFEGKKGYSRGSLAKAWRYEYPKMLRVLATRRKK